MSNFYPTSLILKKIKKMSTKELKIPEYVFYYESILKSITCSNSFKKLALFWAKTHSSQFVVRDFVHN